jgi:hypothetical protein
MLASSNSGGFEMTIREAYEVARGRARPAPDKRTAQSMAVKAYVFHRTEGKKSPADAMRLAREEIARGVNREASFYPFARFGGNVFDVATRPKGESTRYFEKGEAPFRFVGYADELDRSIGHKGWFTDTEFQDDTLRGVVCQVTARKGDSWYIPGYQESANGGCVFDLTGVTDDEVAATNNADSMARRAAEDEQEYQEVWRCGNTWRQASEDFAQARVDYYALNRERRNLRPGKDQIENAYSAIVAKLKRLRKSMEKAKTEMQDSANAARSMRKDHRSTWLDGADLRSFDF